MGFSARVYTTLFITFLTIFNEGCSRVVARAIPGLDSDIDGDGISDWDDNCLEIANDDQIDTDGDHIGDLCDSTPGALSDPLDLDGDGVKNTQDNCPNQANSDQRDQDQDRLGDVCDQTPQGKPVATLSYGAYRERIVFPNQPLAECAVRTDSLSEKVFSIHFRPEKINFLPPVVYGPGFPAFSLSNLLELELWISETAAQQFGRFEFTNETNYSPFRLAEAYYDIRVTLGGMMGTNPYYFLASHVTPANDPEEQDACTVNGNILLRCFDQEPPCSVSFSKQGSWLRGQVRCVNLYMSTLQSFMAYPEGPKVDSLEMDFTCDLPLKGL